MLRSFTGSAPDVHEACMRGARRANAARAAVRDGTEGVGARRTRMQKGAPRSSTAPKRLQELPFNSNQPPSRGTRSVNEAGPTTSSICV